MMSSCVARIKPVLAVIAACLLTTSLTACANSEIGKAVEQSLAADPGPSANPSTGTPPAATSITQTSDQNNSTIEPDPIARNSQLNAPKQPEESPNQLGETTETVSSTWSEKEIPEPLRQYVADLMELEVLTSPDFEPDRTVTRREYVRWLVVANNKMYAHNPGKQIRPPTSKSAKPVFQDVPRTDPDFPLIQGLAEAGILPSRLTGDATVVLFRPDTPLTRAEMILWKVPMDIRRALPTATIDTVKETWGFQDAAKIDPKSLRAVLADFQNGEKANIRRSLGYTNLFQPTKTVSSVEAAATLWYFGYQGEGISAGEAIDIARSKE
ncbi:MAG: S-layer homology domain-containing protein [Hormoscilla sp. GM102CHS1]|nr:S-layer homology domain-containing protein [Hormoscilla sp. GM102CHS1]